MYFEAKYNSTNIKNIYENSNIDFVYTMYYISIKT